jgi:hypothetical protein
MVKIANFCDGRRAHTAPLPDIHLMSSLVAQWPFQAQSCIRHNRMMLDSFRGSISVLYPLGLLRLPHSLP